MHGAELERRAAQLLALLLGGQLHAVLPDRLGVVVDRHRFDAAELLVEIQGEGHVAPPQVLVDGVLVEFAARADGIDLADHLRAAVDVHVVVGHAAQVHAACREVGQGVAPAALVGLERAVAFEHVERHGVGARGEGRLLRAQGVLVGGAGQVLQQYVGVVRVEPGALDRSAQQELGMVHQVLVDGRVAGHEDDHGAPSLAADAAGLLPEAGDAAGVARKEAEIEVADVDAQFQRVGGDDGVDAPLEEVALELAALAGQQSTAVGLDALAQLGVAVGDGAVEALDLLAGAAETDRAHAGAGGGAQQRNGDGGGALAKGRAADSLRQRRVDKVEVAARAGRGVARDHLEVATA
ncbi:MAG: hypothetical protein BWZ09_02727 [Alphaproteobacteria bacterium ADurb.BinA305]|nr:MAG: hypothetical protein BWZ09_02727 [Alphaproteobacteria bacterium ADurb.BinA305]